MDSAQVGHLSWTGVKSEFFGSVEVLKVQRAEWYPTLVGFSFGWYVERLAQRIDDLYEEFGKLMLVEQFLGSCSVV